HRTVPEQHARGPLQGRPPAHHAAAQGTHAAAHRNPDHPLPAGLVGSGDAGQRKPADDRGHQGINSYYLTSDGSTMSYRTRIRTPSFPHLQQIPSVINGSMIADLIAYLGSIDFVMADVDR